jgi:benzaldehyde dehydrogenase (NAD)
MNVQRHNFIDVQRWKSRAFLGGWHETTLGPANVVDPSSGQVIASIGLNGPADVTRAASEAKKAQPAWAAKFPSEPAAILNRAAELLEQNAEELIDWIVRETGSIQPKAAIEIEHGVGFIRHAAASAIEPNGLMLASTDAGRRNYAKRVPHGVVGVISPFNFPLVLSIRAVAASLALGNAVVHKPDPRTPISGGIIIARIFEEAGLPPGLLHVVPGGVEAGEALCADPNVAMISFTGSASAGSRVGEIGGTRWSNQGSATSTSTNICRIQRAA